jgi:hypothetical protein
VLDDAELTDVGQSSADVLGVPGDVLADRLTDHLVREIVLRGSSGGPLTPLADQFNHELTRSQIGRLFAGLGKEVQAALAETNSGGKVTGLLLDEVTDPFSFEVHPPVQPEDAALELPLLPPYISREHDEMLSRVVRAATDGQSGIAVLVGGSSTGKTRACWASAPSSRPLTGPNPPGSSPSPRPPADPRTDTAAVVTGVAWATHICPGQPSDSRDRVLTICGSPVTVLSRMDHRCQRRISRRARRLP